jgi:hypothetical protein
VMLGAIQSLLSKTGKYAMFGKSNIACRQWWFSYLQFFESKLTTFFFASSMIN